MQIEEIFSKTVYHVVGSYYEFGTFWYEFEAVYACIMRFEGVANSTDNIWTFFKNSKKMHVWLVFRSAKQQICL